MNQGKTSQMASRRDAMAGALSLAALAAAPRAQAQSRGNVIYDYLSLTLAKGEAGRPAFVEHVKNQRERINRMGGEIMGLFTPQIGWASNQLAILVRWTGEEPDRADGLRFIAQNDMINGGKVDALYPTLRPATTDPLRAGGIYVHRWFELDRANLKEFIDLSGRGWPDFENRFDSKVFGLFEVAQKIEERDTDKPIRMLLMTRYGSHAIWEQSRDPSTAAMQLFMRRRALTISTTAASTLYLPLA